MTTEKRRVEDRRIQKTRQVLRQAFMEVVSEKGFAGTSVQEIAARANVNRGTFYLHFADKYMLVDSFLREDFQRLLSDALPPASQWDRKTLRLLIEILLNYFERKYHHQPRMPQAIAPLIEQAIHEELSKLLLTWLKQSTSEKGQWHVPMEIVARSTSWAIFGPVLQWSQEESTTSSEQMSEALLLVILEGVAHLAPKALSG